MPFLFFFFLRSFEPRYHFPKCEPLVGYALLVLTLFPQIVAVLDSVTESFNTQYISSIPGKSSYLATLLVNAPAPVSQPTSYTIANIRPFDTPVASAVEFVGLIYLLIISVRVLCNCCLRLVN